jgi:hypothetical protein
LYSSLRKICNFYVKSISDPQYYKTVILFIKTAISSGKLVASDADPATVQENSNNEDDNLLNISIVDDIFKAAGGDIRASVKLVEKCLPDKVKNKIAMIEKLIDEVESFCVFGKTKITDLVL